MLSDLMLRILNPVTDDMFDTMLTEPYANNPLSHDDYNARRYPNPPRPNSPYMEGNSRINLILRKEANTWLIDP